MATPLSVVTGGQAEDGVWVQDAEAPTQGTLRPLLKTAPDVFPVYRDLVTKLAQPKDPFDTGSHPDHKAARTLAVCAGYAYSDAHSVSTIMARMGLGDNRCRAIGMYVDAMFIDSTAFLVQSKDGRVVILAYRGTQPTVLTNWLTDADVARSKVELPIDHHSYDVHSGFYRNVRATRYKVTEALVGAMNGHPVTAPSREGKGPLKPMQALYITGHSLGGAMAAIETILLCTATEYKKTFGKAFQAAYTFGQPMVGSRELAQACDSILRDQVIRFICQKDPVPHVPPRESGNFAHFGREYRFDGTRWVRQNLGGEAGQMSTASFVSAAVAAVTEKDKYLPDLPFRFRYQFDDHAPQHYIEALTPQGGLTEFGDHSYSPQRPYQGLTMVNRITGPPRAIVERIDGVRRITKGLPAIGRLVP